MYVDICRAPSISKASRNTHLQIFQINFRCHLFIEPTLWDHHSCIYLDLSSVCTKEQVVQDYSPSQYVLYLTLSVTVKGNFEKFHLCGMTNSKGTVYCCAWCGWNPTPIMTEQRTPVQKSCRLATLSLDSQASSVYSISIYVPFFRSSWLGTMDVGTPWIFICFLRRWHLQGLRLWSIVLITWASKMASLQKGLSLRLIPRSY